MAEDPDSFTPPQDEYLEAQINGVLKEAFPILLERITHARFADWHRRHSLADDLATRATVEFIQYVRRHGSLPDNVLGYLVTIAKNLAKKDWKDREQLPAFTTVEDAFLFLSKLSPPASMTDAEEGSESTEQALLEVVRAAIEQLPRRQREAVRLYMENPGATQKELGEMMNIGEDGFHKNHERAVASLNGIVRKLTEDALPHLAPIERTAIRLFLNNPGATHKDLGKLMGIGKSGYLMIYTKGVINLAKMVRNQRVSGQ